MKETNLTENQLRSWQPRRPSAELERRIFSRASAGVRFRIEITWGIRLLAPAAACLLVAFSVLHQGNYPVPEQSGSGQFTEAPASNAEPVDPLLLEALKEWAGRLSLDDLDMRRWLGE